MPHAPDTPPDSSDLPLHPLIALDVPTGSSNAELPRRLRGLARCAGLDLRPSAQARGAWITLEWTSEPQRAPFVFPLAAPGEDTLRRVERDLDAATFLQAQWRDEPGLSLGPLSMALGLARATLEATLIGLPSWLDPDESDFWFNLHRRGVHVVAASLSADPSGDEERVLTLMEGALNTLVIGLGAGPAPGPEERRRLLDTLRVLLEDPRWTGSDVRSRQQAGRLQDLLSALRRHPGSDELVAWLAARVDPLQVELAQPRFAGVESARAIQIEPTAPDDASWSLFHVHRTKHQNWCAAATRPAGTYLQMLLALGGLNA